MTTILDVMHGDYLEHFENCQNDFSYPKRTKHLEDMKCNYIFICSAMGARGGCMGLFIFLSGSHINLNKMNE